MLIATPQPPSDTFGITLLLIAALTVGFVVIVKALCWLCEELGRLDQFDNFNDDNSGDSDDS